ncbi:hypothetical protein ACJ3XI_00760 [Litorimonas sp. RW-G-Af-16]|uniref:hypothetical protein n=1 Tax=Litorimonas sp. RW-G-Af-16 TaxID=3241168 RepID=UPI00390C7362
MGIFGQSEGHFLAHIDIFPSGPEPDRRNGPPQNGIRWDFAYAEDFEIYSPEFPMLNMIWPEFLDESGASIPTGIPLIGSFDAKMHIVSEHMIENHLNRIRIGTKFFCMEARIKTASGTIIKTTI